MNSQILLDTGPLVALLDRRDAHHAWAKSQWASFRTPLMTCEAVLSEACFLLPRFPSGGSAVMEFVRRGVVVVAFRLEDHLEPVARLLAKYAAMPMSLADACLVRMSESYADSTVFTLDGHFRLYRRHGRQVIRAITPEQG